VKRIAIIGGGWYGCYSAKIFTEAGYSVTLFEQSNDLFAGASAKNQNRLHQGYHYPRCAQTRLQSKRGFDCFVNRFPELSLEVKNNIYAVSRDNTQVNFKSYIKLLKDEKYSFRQVEIPTFLNRAKIAGAISVDERVIDSRKAQSFWKACLEECHVDVVYGYKVSSREFFEKHIKSIDYDYVVDCTWGHLSKNYSQDIFYENCIYFYLRAKVAPQIGALTIMDGPFFSIYPTGIQNIFTLTSVVNTPFCSSTLISDIQGQQKPSIKAFWNIFYEEVVDFYPSFSDTFEMLGPEFIGKTKLKSRHDRRSTEIENYGDGKFSIISGKIDTVFELDTLLEEIISVE
jgi:hypothetical protein